MPRATTALLSILGLCAAAVAAVTADEAESWQGLDVEWLSHAGEDVVIEKALAEGKVTVFDFYADWCLPCREVDREMRATLEASSDVALRKINVVDWESPVAARYLQRVPNLPYVIVYGTSGRRVDSIVGLDLERLRKAIDKGRKR